MHARAALSSRRERIDREACGSEIAKHRRLWNDKGMTTLQEIEAAIPNLSAAELVALEGFIGEHRLKKPVEWPDFKARLDRIFPNGPPPGPPLSELVDEGRGEY